MGRKTKRQKQRQAQRKEQSAKDKEAQVIVRPGGGGRGGETQLAGTGGSGGATMPNQQDVNEALQGFRAALANAQKRSGSRKVDAPTVEGTVAGDRKARGAKPSPVQVDEAYKRLKALNDLLVAEPKNVLDYLEELGINCQLVKNVQGDPLFDTVVMSMEDINKANAEIARRGTLKQQLERGQ